MVIQSFLRSWSFLILLRFSLGIKLGEFSGQSNTERLFKAKTLLTVQLVRQGAKFCWKTPEPSGNVLAICDVTFFVRTSVYFSEFIMTSIGTWSNPIIAKTLQNHFGGIWQLDRHGMLFDALLLLLVHADFLLLGLKSSSHLKTILDAIVQASSLDTSWPKRSVSFHLVTAFVGRLAFQPIAKSRLRKIEKSTDIPAACAKLRSRLIFQQTSNLVAYENLFSCIKFALSKQVSSLLGVVVFFLPHLPFLLGLTVFSI